MNSQFRFAPPTGHSAGFSFADVVRRAIVVAAIALFLPTARPATADDELAAFVASPGLRVELVADGGLVRQPLAMRFSPDGRLWVLEAGPTTNGGVAGNQPAGGAVVVLDDANRDGRMDRRTVFATGLSAPRGLVLLGDGALVADGGNFLFLRDRNRDSVADETIRVATDLSEMPNRPGGPNGLFLALDNWIYLAGSTLRLRYDGSGGFARDYTDRHEGRGVTQDEMGRLYFGGDTGSLRAERMASGYRWRNLGYRGEAALSVSLGKPDGSPLVARTPVADLLIYRGLRFGAECDGNAFVADASSGQIIRYRLPAGGAMPGPTGSGRGIVVLQAKDARFRPSTMCQGPDGGLYVAGQMGDGFSTGRIWRLVPARSEGQPATLAAHRSLAELMGDLAHSDGWQRDTAQRLIIEKEDPAAAPLVREFALGRANPMGRVHALWTLEGLDAVDRETVQALLADPDPRICATAIRMAEKFLYAPGDPGILAQIVRLAERPDALVRWQLILSLGEAARPEGDAVLQEAVARWSDLPGMVDAVVSSLSGREVDFIAALARKIPRGSPAGASVVTAAVHGLLVAADLRRMTLKPAEATHLTRLFSMMVDPLMPAWLRTAIVDGLERYVPRDRTGRRLRVNLAIAPAPLITFSAGGGSPEKRRIRAVLDSLNWPGKPTAAAESPAALTAAERIAFEKGREAFPIACGACHQPQGQGLAGLAPPLAGSRWVQGDAAIVARIVLCGKVQEMYPMPTLRGNFDDETIAAVLTFVRNSWGNAAGSVAPAEVAAARAATAGRTPMAFTDFELIELADELARSRR